MIISSATSQFSRFVFGLAFLATATLFKPAYADAVNVTGTVTNTAGGGLQGCTVSVDNLSGLTAQDGSFQLAGTVGIPAIGKNAPDFELLYPLLRYSIPSDGSQVSIVLENALGRKVLDLEKGFRKGGRYILDLHPALDRLGRSKFLFLHARVGAQSFVIRLPELLNYRAASTLDAGARSNYALTKSAAMGDSLTISCQGYLTVKKPLTTNSGNLGIFGLRMPNILILMADDMNDWTTMENGLVKTPNLDKLAKSGIFFQRAHASAQECDPSRAAMFTGKFPSSNGIYWNSADFRNYTLTKDIETLPQYFEHRGYESVDAGKIYHNRTEKWSLSGPDGGAAVLPSLMTNPWHHNEFKADKTGFSYNNDAFIFGPTAGKEVDLGDSKSAKFIADYVNRPHAKPFFAACGMVKPHAPLVAPQKYLDMYPLEEINTPDTLQGDLSDVGPIARMTAMSFGDSIHNTVLKYGKWKEALQGYKAAATFADANFGVVLDSLARGPNKDNTIVIFVSDHGVHLGEKQHWWKMTLWNRTTHIPMIIKIPGITPQGAVSPRTVSTQDIYPTLLSLLNYPAKPGVEGRDISQLLGNPYKEWPYPVRTTGGYKNHSVVSETYRYSKYSDGFEEVYNETSDSREFYNIAATAEGKAAKAELQQWLPKFDVPDTTKGKP
jgi:arylsulfatase A-like enzyme